MKSRIRQQDKVSKEKLQQTNIKNGCVKQVNPNNLNNISINNASNNQLKQIIEKLIVKSRSLILSLEKTLKQLDEVRSQKDFWKNHYLTFKNACQKYIKSRGIAPFQYINTLQKTLINCNNKKQQPQNDSNYRSFSLNQLNKTFSLFNSNFNKSPLKQRNCQQNLNTHINKADPIQNNDSQYKNLQISVLKTNAKTVDDTLQYDQTQITPKVDRSFKGIKLGGKTRNQTNVSPIKLNIYDTRSKNNSNYRRKDSLQTKRVQLFSFVRNKNNRQILQNLEVKIN